MNYLEIIEIAERKSLIEKMEVIEGILEDEEVLHRFEYAGLQKLLDASIKNLAEISEGEKNIPEKIKMKIKDLYYRFNEYKEINGKYERPYVKNRSFIE